MRSGACLPTFPLPRLHGCILLIDRFVSRYEGLIQFQHMKTLKDAIAFCWQRGLPKVTPLHIQSKIRTRTWERWDSGFDFATC